MTILRTAILAASLSVAALGSARAAHVQDPASSPEIVKLADVTSDCIAARYLAAREAARRDGSAETVSTKVSLKDAVRQCRPELRLLRNRYDEVFGAGMGEVFLSRSYFPDLNRAVMERILDRPEKRQEIAALQKSHRYLSGKETENCRYKVLLDKKIQEKINDLVPTLKLRDELVGTRFQTTQIDLMLEIDEKDGLPFDFLNPQDGEACFPAFKKRMKALQAEYDAKVRAKAKAGIAADG